MRIYIDTSVLGGCFDIEFETPSSRLLQLICDCQVRAVVSQLVLNELAGAPAEVRQLFDSIPEESLEIIPFSPEAAALAARYIDEGVIGKAHITDARHIAIATVARVDVLASWNFRHIVNLTRIRGYNGVNLMSGYPLLEIRSPQEVLPDETED